jgi:hypothetical protein
MKTTLALLLLFLAAVLPGCGGNDVAAREDDLPAAEGKKLGPECGPVGDTDAGRVHLCYRPGAQDRGRFVVIGTDEPPRTLSVEPPTPIGHWRWAAVSPDGATILAEWSAECEVPIAFLIPAAGGRPRPAFTSDAASQAFGWTVDGRAIVSLLTRTPCSGRVLKPGLYLVPPGGGSTLVRTLRPEPARSLRARTLEELEPAEG